MGKVYSSLTRPIRSFNIENRAAKVISREKPIPAPQYPSTEKQKQLSDEVSPNFLKEHYQKNVQLDQRLKDVFVTSTDPQKIIENPTKESKPLPQDRYSIDEYALESFEPSTIPVGKCSFKQILKFILQHNHDPVAYNSETIATEYKIDKKVIDDILKHFKLYSNMVVSNDPAEIEDPLQQMIDIAVEKKRKKDLEEK